MNARHLNSQKQIICLKPLLYVSVTRVKSINGRMKVKKTYIRADKSQDYKTRPYEIPDICSCDQIYNGVASLVLGLTDYFRKDAAETTMVFNSATTIAKWNGKKMKKRFRKNMLSKIYRKCKRLVKG